MLNRFVVAKRDANRVDMTKRPYLASECEDVSHCEVYRGQILKELSKKVSLIQNEGLDEHRVRDLNDAINKLIREKGHWERQIKKLGGARRPPPPPPPAAPLLRRPPPLPRPSPAPPRPTARPYRPLQTACASGADHFRTAPRLFEDDAEEVAPTPLTHTLNAVPAPLV